MKILTVIPTYCELENLPIILKDVMESVPATEILVVDDNSPDGTGKLAEEFSKNNSKIHVLHRATKSGLGGAYIAGFKWGRERKFDILVEMDADGSHNPKELPSLLAEIEHHGADLALGSRWIPGGKVLNWPKHREILSRYGNLYAKYLLSVNIKDITGGYRAFRTSVFDDIDLDSIPAHGYSFQAYLVWKVSEEGKKIVEVPITFKDRELGKSKMSPKVFFDTLGKVTFWGISSLYKKIFK